MTSKLIITVAVLVVLAGVVGYWITDRSNNLDTNASYTLDEISNHNSVDDCWIVIADKVYDVTSFVNRHPGGEEILKGCGTDATELFQSISGHSEGRAEIELERLEIGRVI